MALGFNLDKPTGLTEVKITAHERYGAKHITVTEDIPSNRLILDRLLNYSFYCLQIIRANN